MSLQLASGNLVIVVTGCSGSGKSTVANGILNNGKFTCRFIFDPSGEYALRFQRRACTTAAELQASIPTGWVIFNPTVLYPGSDIAGTEASKNALAKFLEWYWVKCCDLPGQKIILVDEIWQFCSPNSIPIPLRAIAQNGRKRGAGLLATTQKPNKLNETLIGEATEFISFRLGGRNLLDFLEDSFEDNIVPFPARDLPGLLLHEKVRSHFIAQNLRSGGLRRYELDHVTGKIKRL